MAPRPSRSRSLLLFALLVSLGCAKTQTVTIKPATPEPPELLPSPQLEEFAYKRVLLLPYGGEIDVKAGEPRPLTKKEARRARKKKKKKGTVEGSNESPPPKSGAYYTSRVEKTLLAHGFDVVSSEIVARASKDIAGGDKLSSAEKALVMGKQTKADAVFIIQSIAIEGEVDFYSSEKLSATEVDPSKVEHDAKKGRFLVADSKDCAVRVPHYTVHMEAKLIDANHGDVLWVGDGQYSALDALSESYVAKLDKKCRVVDENFVFTDFVVDERQLEATFTALAKHLVEPLKKDALKGKPIPSEKPKAKKPKPKPEKPKVETAIVSTKRANMRAGPGRRNERLRRVSRKTKVEILESMGEWHKVKLQDGTVGWMHESTLIMTE